MSAHIIFITIGAAELAGDGSQRPPQPLEPAAQRSAPAPPPPYSDARTCPAALFGTDPDDLPHDCDCDELAGHVMPHRCRCGTTWNDTP